MSTKKLKSLSWGMAKGGSTIRKFPILQTAETDVRLGWRLRVGEWQAGAETEALESVEVMEGEE